MKKILASILILIFLLLITFLIILSTVGIETKRFNSLISNKINEVNNNIDLNLNEIKFKLDIKKIKLFLQTKNPKVVYRNVSIPVEEIQVFVVFKSILTSEPQIEKINLVLKQLDINELKIISKNFKPSNLNSFLNNNIIEGSLNCEINIFLDRKNIVQNFIVKGSAINFKTKLVDNLFLNNLKFDFFADKNDILFKNIFGENDFIKVSEGDLKIILSSKFQLNGNFQSQLNYDSQKKNEISILENIKYFKNIIALEANLNNSFLIDFDETYKIVNYEYKNKGKITKSIFNLNEPVKDILSNDEINKFSFFNTEISSNFNLNRKQINLFGKYSLNNGRPVVFNSDSQVEKGSTNLKIDFEYINPINFDLINYKKPNDKIAKIFLNLEKKKNIILVNEINYKDSNNVIFLKDLKLNNNRFESLKNASVKTLSDGKINNDFQIIYNDEIKIKGSQFDAINLLKFLNQKSEKIKFTNISKDIEIDFKNVNIPLSEKLKNFKLFGKIDKGKFIKIISKGSFDNNNFLDITMKHDKANKKKYLEVYSDLTKPLLTEFNFFKGLTGGKLLYTSEISDTKLISELNIENFKVINAPGLVKLLSLADLGGLADLAEGEGISFDSLEIRMQKSLDLLKINEILALGPSISVLMEGYQDMKVTSLRGTLVPAKTLNKMISKIPVIGDIVIPKEVGEGLFGISFKMKGPPGKIKTSIDPIRTITPRFIQKIVERKKNIK